MKRFLKIFVPIVLALCIIAGIIWYLFFYDKTLTQDILLSGARFFRDQGDLSTSSWFYDRAYDQGINQDSVAIEKAEQYIQHGNYTQAEVALTKAINNGGGAQVYIALCKTFVQQDKLLDAVELLDKIADPAIKKELHALRPSAPTASLPADVTYNELITISFKTTDGSTLYVSTDGDYPSTLTDEYTGEIDLKEGYTSVKAIAVSEQGLVSSWVTYGYTVVGIIEEVTISDSAMEQQIRAGLGLTKGETILTSDLWKITDFKIPQNAKDYSVLNKMLYLESLSVDSGVSNQLKILKDNTSIKRLSITNTSLSSEDLDAIGSIYSLESLTMDGCSLATITPLSGLISMKYLNLNNNAIRNISAISSMQDLTELHMSRNALQDLSALTVCKKLTALDVSYNSIIDISALRDLEQLTNIDISHNQITDISILNTCTKLKEFRANNNQISDISALSTCSELTYVNVSNNTLTVIDTFTKLQSITYLNFSYNQVATLPKWPTSSKLITIDGSYNRLTELSGLSGLENLNNVLMDYNEKIKSVAELANCPVLIQVNVYGTKVSDVSMLTMQSIIVNYNPTEGLDN